MIEGEYAVVVGVTRSQGTKKIFSTRKISPELPGGTEDCQSHQNWNTQSLLPLSYVDKMNGETVTSSVGGQNPLSAKVTQILGTSYTDYAVRSALENLSLQFTENTPSSRRQLRANLELQDIQSAGALLEQYEQVLEVIDSLYLC